MNAKDAWGEPPLPAAKSLGGRTLLMWSVLALLAGGLFVYLLFFQPDYTSRTGMSHPAVGRTLPQLHLTPLTGTQEQVRLQDLKGKVVLINYWGTWCPPCRIEFPQIVALHKRMADERDFRLLSVSSSAGLGDEDELRQTTAAFLRGAKADIATYADLSGASKQALAKTAELDGFVFPTTVLLDRQGVIRGLWIGYRETYDQEMNDAVRATLAEKGEGEKPL